MTLSDQSYEDINWWNSNLRSFSPVHREPPLVTLTTDASFIGWGAEF